MKKILSFLLIGAMLLSTVLSFSSCGGNVLIFTKNGDGTCRVGDVKNTNFTSLEIPSQSPDGEDVTWILGKRFENCKKLESITIPATVSQIDDQLFYGCDALTSVTVDEANETYHSDGNCIIETETNTLVAACKTSVIPDYVTAIGNGAFAGVNIETVEIPDSVTYIASGAFKNCKSLRSINIPKSVHSIDGNILGGCSSLESITVEDGNETYMSMDNCIIDMNSTLLLGCKTSVIPGFVYKIEDLAFFGQSEMKSINIPSSVREFGKQIFDGCTSLETVNYSDIMYRWESIQKHEDWDYNMPSYNLIATDNAVRFYPEVIE